MKCVIHEFGDLNRSHSFPWQGQCFLFGEVGGFPTQILLDGTSHLPETWIGQGNLNNTDTAGISGNKRCLQVTEAGFTEVMCQKVHS